MAKSIKPGRNVGKSKFKHLNNHNMDSKKKEVIVTVHNTEELEAVDRNVFRYTAEPVVKKYIEDFCDEATGEVVSVPRTPPHEIHDRV